MTSRKPFHTQALHDAATKCLRDKSHADEVSVQRWEGVYKHFHEVIRHLSVSSVSKCGALFETKVNPFHALSRHTALPPTADMQQIALKAIPSAFAIARNCLGELETALLSLEASPVPSMWQLVSLGKHLLAPHAVLAKEDRIRHTAGAILVHCESHTLMDFRQLLGSSDLLRLSVYVALASLCKASTKPLTRFHTCPPRRSGNFVLHFFDGMFKACLDILDDTAPSSVHKALGTMFKENTSLWADVTKMLAHEKTVAWNADSDLLAALCALSFDHGSQMTDRELTIHINSLHSSAHRPGDTPTGLGHTVLDGFANAAVRFLIHSGPANLPCWFRVMTTSSLCHSFAHFIGEKPSPECFRDLCDALDTLSMHRSSVGDSLHWGGEYPDVDVIRGTLHPFLEKVIGNVRAHSQFGLLIITTDCEHRSTWHAQSLLQRTSFTFSEKSWIPAPLAD